jgi:hypothetical protein
MRDMRLGVAVGSWICRLPTREERRGAAGAFSHPITPVEAMTEHVDARRGGAAGVTFVSGPATANGTIMLDISVLHDSRLDISWQGAIAKHSGDAF